MNYALLFDMSRLSHLNPTKRSVCASLSPVQQSTRRGCFNRQPRRTETSVAVPIPARRCPHSIQYSRQHPKKGSIRLPRNENPTGKAVRCEVRGWIPATWWQGRTAHPTARRSPPRGAKGASRSHPSFGRTHRTARRASARGPASTCLAPQRRARGVRPSASTTPSV
jgi:hypothetical protein